jgi:two-component system, OmpR family, alkaline phosphatase synthesis response regulator PhoP
VPTVQAMPSVPAASLVRPPLDGSVAEIPAAPLSRQGASAGEPSARRILIVHRDSALVQHLRQNLEHEGHEVLVEPEAAWGIGQALKFNPDLVIADLMVLESGEQNLLRQLRSERDNVPVLVLSAHPEEATRLRGFRLGVDDFLVHPFRITELHRRIDVLLGRRAPQLSGVEPADAVVRFGDVEIHPGTRTVLRAGAPVPMRLKEFDLLMTLIGRAGKVVSRIDLLREVWGYRTWVATRTVDTHVAELRRKLEPDPSNPQHILTVRKIGYRLQRE